MRNERPPNSLQRYAALQKVPPPPLNRATQAAKPSGYGPLRSRPTECDARQQTKEDQRRKMFLWMTNVLTLKNKPIQLRKKCLENHLEAPIPNE